MAARVLAELGADVIKIEAPGEGDVMLRRPPTQRGISVGYSYYNQGKRSVVLDLRNQGDQDLAKRLLRRSDVFVNNMRPGVAERLGVGYEEVSRLNPRIVYGYASAWGRSGPLAPWPGADPVVQFYSGWCSIQGEPGGVPEFSRFVGQLDAATAAILAGGILQALIARETSGRGQRVDVSLLHCALLTQITRVAEYFAGAAPSPMGTACATTVPHQAFHCGDGKYLAVGVVHDGQWKALCRALEAVDLADDPRFTTNPDRVRNREALVPELEKIFLSRPVNWWRIVLTRHNVPHSRFYEWENLRYHTQVRDNDFMSEVEVPDQGGLYLPNVPWEFASSERPKLAVIKPGQHSDEIRRWLADDGVAGADGRGEYRQGESAKITGASPGQVVSASGGPRRALEGLTVLDVTQGLCGPYVSQMLVDAGASVIKIEPPEGDYARQMGPPFLKGQSTVFLALNRGKKSITLDLTDASGRAALHRLLRTADVFLEDWGTGGAEERGCAYAQTRQDNPSLVYAAITPYGERGPLRDMPGAELVIQAAAEYGLGLGRVDGPPVRTGADVANIDTALLLFDSLLAALWRRARSGAGERVSISQFGTLLYFRGAVWASQSDPDVWDGWAARQYAPPEHGYRTMDGRIYFVILRGNAEEFDRLMIELGLEDHLLDPRFGGGGRDAVGIGRFATEVKPIWELAFRERTTAELVEILNRFKVLVAPLYDYGSLFAEPAVAQLGLVAEVDHPAGGRYRTLRPPWSFSDMSVDLGAPAPLLGEHSQEVLSRAGFGDREIQRLASSAALVSRG